MPGWMWTLNFFPASLRQPTPHFWTACAGACSRSFYVGDVESKDVSAKYENGILTLSLPKQVKKELPASTSIAIS